MDVRLGVTYTTKELTLELGDEADGSSVRADVDAALANPDGVLWLTDRRGRQIGVPTAKLAYVEISSSDTAHRVGFGS